MTGRPSVSPMPFHRCPHCGRGEQGVGLFDRVWAQPGRRWECEQVCQKCGRTVARWATEAGWVVEERWREETWAMSPGYSMWNMS